MKSLFKTMKAPFTPNKALQTEKKKAALLAALTEASSPASEHGEHAASPDAEHAAAGHAKDDSHPHAFKVRLSSAPRPSGTFRCVACVCICVRVEHGPFPRLSDPRQSFSGPQESR